MKDLVLITEDKVIIELILREFKKNNYIPFHHLQNRYVINDEKGDYIAIYSNSDSIKNEYSKEELKNLNKEILKPIFYLFEYSDELFLKRILFLLNTNISAKFLIDDGENIQLLEDYFKKQ